MKASHALLATTVFGQDTYNYNFGLNAVDCGSDYFRDGAHWPLQSFHSAGSTVRLCQNMNGEQHNFATLMDVETR